MKPIPSKEATDRFQEINGVRLHYNELGSGPALICTHGGGPGANAWDNTKWIFAELAEKFHTILLDTPGYGESQKYVKRNGVPMDAFVSGYIIGLMDHLGIDKAHLHGSAQYVPAVVRTAIDHPDRVGKLIISCGSVGHEVPGLPKREGRSPGLESLNIFADNPTRENMVRTMEFFTKRPEFRTDEIVDMRLQAALREGVIESRREMQSSSNSDLHDRLPMLQTESLILWGNEDNVTYVDGALRCLYNMPKSRAVIFGDGSGHFVFQEHPEECAHLVIDFLEH
jgi:4,5:9,10-diseco-3-hydroxy-5,9,17-trioxoandrosta-1(10),2-diene-4-oate hydrolase